MKIITNTILSAALVLGLGSAAQAAGGSSGHVENRDAASYDASDA